MRVLEGWLVMDGNLAKREVQRDVALADRCRQRTYAHDDDPSIIPRTGEIDRSIDRCTNDTTIRRPTIYCS